MATVFSGYYALGTGITNAGVFSELSGGSYARLAVTLTGNQLAGLTQAVGAFVAATTPTTGNIYYGAIFDSLTGGNLIAYWALNSPFTATTTLFPALTVNVVLENFIQIAVNQAVVGAGSPGTYGSLFDAGAQIGTVNGQPMLAGSRLGLTSQGFLIPHLGTGQWMSAADVQNVMSFGGLQANSVNNNITALAGGSLIAGSTPVMSGFVNRVTTVATSLDSVALPSPAQGGVVGTMLTVFNDSGTSMMLFADTGAAINTTATTSITMATSKSAMFIRAAGLMWTSIPTVPS